MVSHVKPAPLEYVVSYYNEGYHLEIQPRDGGWEISCPPGPLAAFLLAAAPPETIKQRGPGIIVQFSSDLDRQISCMIQTLIDLRYQTGRVQLEIWGDL